MPTELMRPPLSVVIAVHNGADLIRPCLGALERQPDRATFEVIVADSSTDGTDIIVRTEFPAVRLIHTEAPLGIPQLRGRGIAAATGAIIAILDPFSVAEVGWAAAVVGAHAASTSLVIGGSVDLYQAETQGHSAWALFFNEYGMFMPPVAAGPVPIVPGCNVAYKRACLFEGDRPRQPVFWKTFVNQAAEASGTPLELDPGMRVSLNKPVPVGDFLRTRAWHGRCFAGSRVAGAPWTTRLGRAATAPLLPLVLALRWTRVFWPKGRRRGRYVRTLPLQLALFGAWAWGEFIGYLRGPGTTCDRLYY